MAEITVYINIHIHVHTQKRIREVEAREREEERGKDELFKNLFMYLFGLSFSPCLARMSVGIYIYRNFEYRYSKVNTLQLRI